MKTQFKTILALVTLGMVGYAAYAENITISTFYPSPYGSYQTLETTTLQGTGGTGNVWMAPTGGNVGIGFPSPTAPASKLDVRGGHIRAADISGGPTAYLQGTPAGAFFGAIGTQAVNIGNSEMNNTLVVDNRKVGIGVDPNTVPEKLSVAGAIRLQDSDTPSQSGPLLVDCSTGPCYAIAVYS